MSTLWRLSGIFPRCPWNAMSPPTEHHSCPTPQPPWFSPPPLSTCSPFFQDNSLFYVLCPPQKGPILVLLPLYITSLLYFSLHWRSRCLTSLIFFFACSTILYSLTKGVQTAERDVSEWLEALLRCSVTAVLLLTSQLACLPDCWVLRSSCTVLHADECGVI